MDTKIIEYYREAEAAGLVSFDAVAAAARAYLARALPDAAPEYLARQDWARLVVGLFHQGAQVCAQCGRAEGLTEFKVPLNVRSRCRRCRVVNGAAQDERRRSRQRERYKFRQYFLEVLDAVEASPAAKRMFLRIHGIRLRRDSRRADRAR